MPAATTSVMLIWPKLSQANTTTATRNATASARRRGLKRLGSMALFMAIPWRYKAASVAGYDAFMTAMAVQHSQPAVNRLAAPPAPSARAGAPPHREIGRAHV